VKVLLDECIDWRLARDIAGHDVRTVRQMGWTGVRNGELLALAAGQFDVFVTLDSHLPDQQRTDRIQMAIIILRPKTSRLSDVRPLTPSLLAALAQISPGIIKLIDR
jgi:predicted nuclease of predicted toxin-antitoxin system